MKKFLQQVLCMIAVASVVCTPAAFAATVLEAPVNSYVNDSAQVLSDNTISNINQENDDLYELCGAQIAVATVEYTGTMSTEEYCAELINAWDVGSAEQNNGVLLLLVTGAEDYHCVQGIGLERMLPTSEISSILQTYLEPDFAAGDYDKGVEKTFAALLRSVKNIYGISEGRPVPAQPDAEPQPGYNVPAKQEGALPGIFGIVIFLIVVIAIIAVLSSFARPNRAHTTRYTGNQYRQPPYYSNYPPRPRARGGSGFTSGLVGGILGGMLSGSAHNHRPPRGGSGFGSGRSSSGFSGGRSSGFGVGRSSGGRFSGGGRKFGGGSSRGGGAGRGH